MKKNVIITGGAGRIGSALALDLVKQGHKVLLGDINKPKLLKIKKKLNSKNVEIFHGDLTTKTTLINLLNFVQKNLKIFMQQFTVLIPHQENGEQDLRIWKKNI